MKKFLFFFVLPFLVTASALFAQPSSLEQGFLNPPVAARPKALWPWVNGNFSLSQISLELEEARQKGMGGFDIWDVGTMMNPEGIVPDGPPFLSDRSLEGIAHTVREAERLGLEIGLISSSSWNAGGAWVRPEHGAMGLFRSDTVVQGPLRFSGVLPFPNIPEVYEGRRKTLVQRDPATGLPVFYRDVAVLAYPLTRDSNIANIKLIADLSRQNTTGGLNWKVPAGRWRIVRYVCAPTGQPLAIPSPLSQGLMLDHFSAEAQEANMRHVLDRLKSVLGPLANRSLKYLYEDSYEVNSAIWTPRLPEEFERRAGYGLMPYLPVLDGFEVGGAETTRRFLYDFTKVLSDLIIENHYVKGRLLSEQEGLGFYAEAGGPGKPIHNVPFEDLKALGALTVPRGEFWNKHPQLELLQIVKGIASAAHIYNQVFVEAESFTSVWLWQEGPSELKPLADRAMCEGLNRFVYHTFPHSPPESGRPGWIYNFGTLINTTNGWWPKSQAFHEYLGRSCYLLQQGNFVGDVAFYYGDEAPNFVPPKKIPESLGFGYDYDVVNTEAILTKMTVRDGRIYLPHGQYYEVLVLPEETRINPQVLQKLEEMVKAGAIVMGPRPGQSYGLKDAAGMDRLVRAVAQQLWGRIDGVKVKEHSYGKGKVVWGKTIRELLEEKGVVADVQTAARAGEGAIDFIHRRTETADIYFIRNKKQERWSGAVRFRVSDKTPEYWNPATGEMLPVAGFKQEEGLVSLPLLLEGEASCFIVFQHQKQEAESRAVNPEEEPQFTRQGPALLKPTGQSLPQPLILEGPWEIRFAHQNGTPVLDTLARLSSWRQSEKEAIRYFSGAAAYHLDFELLPEQLDDSLVLFLELNKVREIAEVYLNGHRLGYHWHPSQRLDITGYAKPGSNHLMVEVVNSINNQLVGDAKKPAAYRQMRSNIFRLPNAWTTPFADAPLIEAGLLGPVRVSWGRLR